MTEIWDTRYMRLQRLAVGIPNINNIGSYGTCWTLPILIFVMRHYWWIRWAFLHLIPLRLCRLNWLNLLYFLTEIWDPRSWGFKGTLPVSLIFKMLKALRLAERFPSKCLWCFITGGFVERFFLIPLRLYMALELAQFAVRKLRGLMNVCLPDIIQTMTPTPLPLSI